MDSVIGVNWFMVWIIFYRTFAATHHFHGYIHPRSPRSGSRLCVMNRPRASRHSSYYTLYAKLRIRKAATSEIVHVIGAQDSGPAVSGWRKILHGGIWIEVRIQLSLRPGIDGRVSHRNERKCYSKRPKAHVAPRLI